MTNKVLYCCYSIPQRDYLTKNGIRYEVCGKSMTSDRPFWVYLRTEKLDRVLKQWSLRY